MRGRWSGPGDRSLITDGPEAGLRRAPEQGSDSRRRAVGAPQRFLVGSEQTGALPRGLHWLRPVYWSVHSLFWDSRPFQEAIQVTADWLTRYMGPRGGRILDLGCGTGSYAAGLAEAGFDVVATDFSPGMLKQARRKARLVTRGSVTVEHGDFNAPLRFPSDTFDAVICAAILQRATNPPRFLAEVARVLHEGGLLLVIVVAAGPNVRRNGTLSGTLFRMARKVPGWSSHARTCSRDEVMALLDTHGYTLIEEALLPGGLALLARRRPVGPTP